MKCYKVVYIDNGKFYSLFTPMKGFGLEYQLGKTVKAKVGKLFVFKTQKQAEEWCGYYGAILECKTRSIERINEIAWPPIRGMSSNNIIKWMKDVKSFWQGQYKGTIYFPQGTYVTKQLTPVKVVYPKKRKNE